ncbi:enoyl-CoA hydratase/carnithine racemase [Sporormia fimetaria CBS 119925]|uniref:Enoyl-CoA hydratase/carnithine racemase n=1 Tax=Sporormia fimetaria CBS 119925 TaxID=1340428 RepID=A0A6A6VHH5_9PLEO|nr:enoyl-CoA hydratase/carnithine racemase [Sporormia fimetaria CBS 119925]
MPTTNPVTYTPSPTGISLITLSRPTRRNAVDPPTAQALYTAFLSFEADHTQKVCVFHGENGTFCAGADLQDVASRSSTTSETQQHFGPVEGRNIGPMGPSRMQVKKPVICAVSGYAVAGGLELALLADIRVVEEDAILGVFCRRFGVPLIDGGTVRLQAVVGLGRALDMILTGRAVGAKEALSMGLANRVVPKGRALEEAVKIARLLVGFPQECMRRDRESTYNAAYGKGGFEEKLRFEFENGVGVVKEEGIEGARRFAGGQGRAGKL